MATNSKISSQIEWSNDEPDESEFRELHDAIKSGKVGRNEYSGSNSDLEEDDAEEPDEPGPKVLWCAQHNEFEKLRKVLDVNPDLLRFQDQDGYTALHRAAYSDSKECLVELLKRGADLKATTQDGWTPLHSACRWNRVKSVEILLAWGADVNHETEGGQTPLHLAAVCPDALDTLTVLLLHKDIKPLSKNCQGDTPLDIAKRNSNPTSIFDACLPFFCDLSS